MSTKHKRKTNRPIGVSKKMIRKQKTKDRIAKKKESNAQE